MSISKFNAEGYYDPTPYEALLRIEREATKAPYRPMVFICSPYAGDIERNIRKAQGYCRFAVSRNCIPIAPHLLFPQFMDVNDKIKMYKKEKIKMYKVVHSCYLYLRRDSNGRQLKSTTKYNKSHGIKT